ncbi:MAG: FHA domain-containing protein [Lachnospiraceae bacterium]|nr:FHA domain-containing protein [Lachnospiraceae bacterium]
MDDVKRNMLLLQPETVLEGRYKVLCDIASGGFGTTYKVWDEQDKVERAMKEYFPQNLSTRLPDGRVVPYSKSKQEGFEHGKLRFVEEAEMIYHLNGLPKNGVARIVMLTDYFGANDTKYYVMEYIDGKSLYNELCENPNGLSYIKVINYLNELCDTLDELHTKHDIFHRDISPENIMLNRNGHLQLIDFGNARNISAIKGHTINLKVNYAPIEQYTRQGEQGSFTDVYSLAATAYHLLTGQVVPRVDDRLDGVTYVPLCEIKPEISERVSKAFDHALEIHAKNRTQTMREFKQELGIEELLKKERLKRGKAIPYYKVLVGDVPQSIKCLESERELVLGRSKEADIYVGDNQFIGRKHCSIRFNEEEEMFYIIDYSKNGTYIDNKSLPQGREVKVSVGTQVILANHIYEFELGVKYE